MNATKLLLSQATAKTARRAGKEQSAQSVAMRSNAAVIGSCLALAPRQGRCIPDGAG